MQIACSGCMPVIMVRIFPPATKKAPLEGFLSSLLGPTRVQQGCLGCSLASEVDSDALLYIESWESDADLLRRLQSDDYGKILIAMEMSTRAPEVSICRQIDDQGMEFINIARLSHQD